MLQYGALKHDLRPQQQQQRRLPPMVFSPERDSSMCMKRDRASVLKVTKREQSAHVRFQKP